LFIRYITFQNDIVFTVTKHLHVTENIIPLCKCINEPCNTKNSWQIEKFQVSVVLLLWLLQSNATAHLACCCFSSKMGHPIWPQS